MAHQQIISVPLHRALSEPILMAGAPRAITIAVGTLAAAIGLGLGLWPVGLLIWIAGQTSAVAATKRDPAMIVVAVRHLKHKGYLSC